ncbi:16S rRNA (cytosine(967)-C(5))-methyltransferase RsmB [Edwardsiella anguillarum]|uniref:16S rRNA (cytosine(967)-C(5))-methyltransferase RsmB n=1 Tax=Edwardsiella anguillarum TaxID=1821960 RepID=UPI0024B6E026|nr:16S rRNA (cytosine(967)-C(5))-methyltransferase RsmB [Edwardsiella anguillarum]WHP80020.1 16S rRNA (cytosine(967)-C(5))-methyltransferase RsmB [Edwardsiella anguillarum]WHQ17479.1 16S rRNA (cytosine(967)-C(5))-methyltransferase RsmB [Edwardsiella anguillarum]WHQ21016.1 16S rRNA (cytosine(967)-C(5))-methyltransferase RsmB [Edwardsiella anguillarum]WHQ24539.1 16S rRNA (cytosine(967)-C(5))-methyltransferase RsmB [Edwardsiella anguillarum]WHQ28106.1 16S rRNA (cytosine(967)-C(5))-methyltransfera
MKNTPYNLRAIAARTLSAVLDQGQSLSSVLPGAAQPLSDKDRALLQELCFGTLRVLPQLEWIVQQLMAKVLTGKQRPLHYLLLVGLYQLIYTRIPPHAALAETVDGAVALKRPQLKGLINGVLRQFQRQQQPLLLQSQQHASHWLHPSWLLKRLQQAYPAQWQSIADANNQRPPMWLRVNRRHHARDAYLALLQQAGIDAVPHETFPDALRLQDPQPVSRLPGFEQGWVTVQDASAQHSVDLLDPQDGEQILDLCCAPGGKTTHILEAAPKAHVLAVDVDESRLKRVRENLQRLQQHAEIRCGDGRTPDAWASGRQFDRILLDAPCSATGVIRRHPDIKWLRRDSDIAELAALQREIIDAIWPFLKSGGVMVYATCSILPQENQEQILAFLSRHPDARLSDSGDIQRPGLQFLPQPDAGDGFFYAKLIKA